jgi:2-polyprenyl-6-methoxyphenol hydroxylase-like FAD-dependent oxidoreductase
MGGGGQQTIDAAATQSGAACSAPADPVLRVAVAGGGFSGAILARILNSEPGVEVVVFEQSAKSSVRKHWTQPVTGAGLNLNPNALATLSQIDPELVERLKGIGLPRNTVCASTVSGRHLYDQDMVGEKLAACKGLRVRWDDANTLIREAAGESIRWETIVVDHQVEESGKVTVTTEHNDGTRTVHNDFDLFVAGEGRYSPTRARVTGKPETTFGDVCNFRILVPNCQPDGTPWPSELGTGLFDDLQLVYNDTPSECNLSADSPLRQDEDFMNTVMRSTPRVGIMRIPASKFREDVGESLYLFGNFAIPDKGQIPEASKTKEAMHCLFTPASGDESMTAEAKFIRQTLTDNAEQLHWARFQDIEPVYGDSTGHVLMLGDACHAFCPSLGQGATTSIEDACVAADELLGAVRKARSAGAGSAGSSMPAVVEKIGQRQTDRMRMIRDASTEAGDHVRFLEGDSDGVNCLAEDVGAWVDDAHSSGWRDTIRRVWLEHPQISNTRANNAIC